VTDEPNASDEADRHQPETDESTPTAVDETDRTHHTKGSDDTVEEPVDPDQPPEGTTLEYRPES